MLTRKQLIKTNKVYRERESKSMHLWPINNQFNPADKAIRQLYEQYRKHIEFGSRLEYELALDNVISDIVNKLV